MQLVQLIRKNIHVYRGRCECELNFIQEDKNELANVNEVKVNPKIMTKA